MTSGDRLLLTGPNGAGKSTVLSALAGRLRLTSGDLTVHQGARVAVLSQEVPEWDSSKTASETYRDHIDRMAVGEPASAGRGAPSLRSLGLLDSVSIGAPVGKLSQGQQRRLHLALCLAERPDLLMLDEPTDHLDMESITALNTGLVKFPGVLIFSSRDHQIVQTTANRIMEIVNGQLIDKITSYDEYLESDEMARKRTVFAVTEKDD